MALLRWQIMQRKWLFCANCIIGFSLFVYLVQNPQQNEAFENGRWLEEAADNSGDNSLIPCVPKKNVVFLKTHKCASSSVQNMLLRNARKKNLTVVLPISPKFHYLSVGKPFTRNVIAGAPWEALGYNILCHHMVFNQREVEKLMPSDTIYFSIVRNPVSLFESLYAYNKLEGVYKMDIEEFARATRNITSAQAIWQRSLLWRGSGFAKNPMLYDFGVNPKYFGNRKYIMDSIKMIDKRFDFIMLAERFDESIVILRHILCWELDDVISLTVNARMESYKKNLSDKGVRDLQGWHWGDQMLYDHFVAKFEKTVREFGPERLARETEELRRRRQEMFESCVEETVGSRNLTNYRIWSWRVLGFKLRPNATDDTCQDLAKPENFFTNEIRQHQIIRSLEKGAPKTLSVYHLLDVSKLKGIEKDIAQRHLASYKWAKSKKVPRRKKG